MSQLSAVQSRYGTVGVAARVLGLPHEPGQKTWTNETVLAGIRRLQAACASGQLRPIDLKRLDTALYRAVLRRYGRVAEAIKAASGSIPVAAGM